MTAEELDRIAAIVYERTGLVFPENRRIIAEAGIRRGMAAARINDLEQYATVISRDTVMLDELFAQLTVGETYFFRESDQLDYIRREVLPHLRPAGRGLRVWSAGCSTGEEPYTLSMILHDEHRAVGATVLGTDLSRARLRVAQRGRYGAWSMRGVSDEIIKRHFHRRDGMYEIQAPLRTPVEFRYLNLGLDTFPSPALGVWGMDLILCRNVLIYFDETSIAQVATKLLDSLTDDGWLFLGASDPMLSDMVPCDVVITSAGLAYRRARAAATTPVPGMAVVTATPVIPDVIPVPEDPILVTTPRVDVPPPVAPLPVSAVATEETEAEYISRIRTLANRGRLREADEWCARGLERWRESAELMYLHAVLLAEAGRHADAATAARRAIYLDRTLIVAHIALGSALRRTGDVQGARLAFGNAIALLDKLPAKAIVPASGNEPAGTLVAATRVQLTLAEAAA